MLQLESKIQLLQIIKFMIRTYREEKKIYHEFHTL